MLSHGTAEHSWDSQAPDRLGPPEGNAFQFHLSGLTSPTLLSKLLPFQCTSDVPNLAHLSMSMSVLNPLAWVIPYPN